MVGNSRSTAENEDLVHIWWDLRSPADYPCMVRLLHPDLIKETLWKCSVAQYFASVELMNAELRLATGDALRTRFARLRGFTWISVLVSYSRVVIWSFYLLYSGLDLDFGMAITTWSGSKSPVKKPPAQSQATSECPQHEPLKHFILPNTVSDQARFILLRHPRDSNAQRFFFCPHRGLYQFTKISASPNEPRSLLFTPSDTPIDQSQAGNAQDDDDQSESRPNEGYISKTADLFVATPFDLAFLLLPLVIPGKAHAGKALFQPLEDMLEERIREDRELRYLYEHGRSKIEEAMSKFCDTIDAGDEQMFRPSEEKFLQLILGKVETAVRAGLPSSLEEKFVTRPLEAPILSVKREEITVSVVKVKPKSLAPDEEGDEEESDTFDSQSSAASTAPSAIFSEVSTTTSTGTIIPDTVSSDLLLLQKQRTVLEFILASYVPDRIADRLRARLTAKDSTIDFVPLDNHLASLAALRAEALSSRSITDFSRKRGLEDDESTELRAEKKQKQEDEDRKKRLGESNGVRALKKVNVVGMKKMSAFFTKKPAAKIG